MQKIRKKILLAATLIIATVASAFIATSVYAYVQRMTFGLFVSNLITMKSPMPPGTFSLDIAGDAIGFQQFCDMFQHFTVSKLGWQGAFPSYPPPTKVYITLNTRSISFEKTDTWTYHLSIKGLNEFSIKVDSDTMLLAQASSGELDLTFTNEGHTLDITGPLSGNVHFIFNVPSLQPFNYEGSQLQIDVHLGS